MASATSSTAVMPQSTVRTRPTPSSASRAERVAGHAVALLEPARKVPDERRLRAREERGRRARWRRCRRRRSHRERRSELRSGGNRGSDAIACLSHVSEQERVVAREARPRGTSAPPPVRRSRGAVSTDADVSLTPSSRAQRTGAAGTSSGQIVQELVTHGDGTETVGRRRHPLTDHGDAPTSVAFKGLSHDRNQAVGGFDRAHSQCWERRRRTESVMTFTQRMTRPTVAPTTTTAIGV